MFGLVITTEAHLAFSCARTHSKNTAEMTAMIEALSFFWPRGPVARDMGSCILHDSKHAAGLCLGTIQARTHVQLALACHAPNKEYGLPSGHNLATRWDRHNFDTSACCGDCNSNSEVLEKCIA